MCLKQAALVPVSLDWLLFVKKTMFVFTVHIHPGVTESENPEVVDFSNSWKWFNGWSKVCDGCKCADALTHTVSSFHWKQTFKQRKPFEAERVLRSLILKSKMSQPDSLFHRHIFMWCLYLLMHVSPILLFLLSALYVDDVDLIGHQAEHKEDFSHVS